MGKTLSVIIPTYNMERYLEKCLSSLIVSPSEMESLEVLVIIDGATDRSAEIARGFQWKYPDTFRVIEKENGNYGSCVNRGIREAVGKYVRILDADDYVSNNFEGYLQYLNRVDVDMVLTPYRVVDEHDRISRHEAFPFEEGTILGWECMGPVFTKHHLQMHAVTYRLDNVLRIDYHQTEGISYTDQEWIFTPLSVVESACYYPHEIYCYLVGRVGQTMNPDVMKRSFAHNEKCVRRIAKDYGQMELRDRNQSDYLRYKALASIRKIYRSYLMDSVSEDLSGLNDFDKYIESVCPDLMSDIDKTVLPYTSFCYIKKWKTLPNRALNPFVTYVYKTFSELTGKIIRHIK